MYFANKDPFWVSHLITGPTHNLVKIAYAEPGYDKGIVLCAMDADKVGAILEAHEVVDPLAMCKAVLEGGKRRTGPWEASTGWR
ncbi:MAG: hypothetical protein R3E96_16485 [Planctomycetota bacterium]